MDPKVLQIAGNIRKKMVKFAYLVEIPMQLEAKRCENVRKSSWKKSTEIRKTPENMKIF